MDNEELPFPTLFGKFQITLQYKNTYNNEGQKVCVGSTEYIY